MKDESLHFKLPDFLNVRLSVLWHHILTVNGIYSPKRFNCRNYIWYRGVVLIGKVSCYQRWKMHLWDKTPWFRDEFGRKTVSWLWECLDFRDEMLHWDIRTYQSVLTRGEIICTFLHWIGTKKSVSQDVSRCKGVYIIRRFKYYPWQFATLSPSLFMQTHT